MKKEERLFSALNNVDDQLLKRCEGTQKRRTWPAAIGALAACAAILAIVCLPKLGQRENAANKPTQTLSFTGGGMGELHLCSIQYGPKPNVGFAIYVNEEIYTILEENGVYTIRPINTLPEGFPPIDLTISHMEGWDKAAAMEKVTQRMEETYARVSEAEEREASLFRSASDGTDWDDAQVEVFCVDDGYGGSFVLTSRYFTEAEEGHGVRFRDMIGTFTLVYEGVTTSPEWVGELQSTAIRLMDAIFAARLDKVSDLLAEGAEVNGYGEDVSDRISVASMDYIPDNDQEPSSAIVTVKCRTSTEEGYDYLTMELIRTDAKWLLTWAGIEK